MVYAVRVSASARGLPQNLGMRVNSFDQGRDMLGRRELANAVSQIENVRRPCAVGIGMRGSKTV
jgi:hypothetical protein